MPKKNQRMCEIYWNLVYQIDQAQIKTQMVSNAPKTCEWKPTSKTSFISLAAPSQRHVARHPLAAASRGPPEKGRINCVCVKMDDANELWAEVMETTWKYWYGMIIESLWIIYVTRCNLFTLLSDCLESKKCKWGGDPPRLRNEEQPSMERWQTTHLAVQSVEKPTNLQITWAWYMRKSADCMQIVYLRSIMHPQEWHAKSSQKFIKHPMTRKKHPWGGKKNLADAQNQSHSWTQAPLHKPQRPREEKLRGMQAKCPTQLGRVRANQRWSEKT